MGKYKRLLWLCVAGLLALGASGLGAAQTTVTVWAPHDFDVRFGDVHEYLWAPFERANPGIKIEWTRVASGYNDRVQVSMAAGVAPDILAVDGILVPAWAENGWIRPLPESVIPESVRQDYWPPALEEMTWKGQLHALALETNSHVLFYNVPHFEQAGVEPPTHWEDLPELGRRLTRDLNNDGANDRWALQMSDGSGEGGMWIVSAWIWQNRGDILKDGQILADRPEAIDAIQFVGDLRHVYDVVPRVGVTYQGFSQGGASMYINGPTYYGQIEKTAPDLEWDVVATPWPEDGVRVSGVGGWHFGMNPNAQDEDATFRVMQYIASPEFVEKLATSYGTPVRRSVALGNPLYQSGRWQVAFEQMQLGKARPRTPLYTELSRIMQEAFMAVTRENRPASEALTIAAEQLRALGIGR